MENGGYKEITCKAHFLRFLKLQRISKSTHREGTVKGDIH